MTENIRYYFGDKLNRLPSGFRNILGNSDFVNCNVPGEIVDTNPIEPAFTQPTNGAASSFIRNTSTLLFGSFAKTKPIIEQRLNNLPLGISEFLNSDPDLKARTSGRLSEVRNDIRFVLLTATPASWLVPALTGYYMNYINMPASVTAASAAASSVIACSIIRGGYMNLRAWLHYKDNQSKALALLTPFPGIGTGVMTVIGLSGIFNKQENKTLRSTVRRNTVSVLKSKIADLRGVYTIEN
jgi:hypothetical protein